MATPLRIPPGQKHPPIDVMGGRKPSKTDSFESPFDRYTKTGSVGSGGSGIVVKVQSQDGKPYALKYLSPEHVTSEKRKRFKNELWFSARNRHPNIITVVDSGFVELDGEKCPFYVMPLYPATLRELMKKGLTPAKVLPLFTQVLDGVEAAHKQNIWHRDLKPENILCDPDVGQTVVADFGIAHFAEEALHTSIETKVGARLANFQYAAPEQREKAARVDHRADIFALGKILNEMFTRTIPDGVDFKKVGAIAPEYAYLDDLISVMLKQSVDERPSSIDEIKKELLRRGNAFVVRQKIDELEGTVVQTSKIVDPLITDPIRLVGVDSQDGHVILRLSQPVNRLWKDAFMNMRQFTHIPGECAPKLFTFDRSIALLPFRDVRRVQQYVDLFKEYLKGATKEYGRILMSTQQTEEQKQRDELQSQLAEQQHRDFILKNVKV
jgi:serine/threonine protein kinase